MADVVRRVTAPVMAGLRKLRNAWHVVSGADLEDRPRDPNDPPGGNASGNVGGLGGGANW